MLLTVDPDGTERVLVDPVAVDPSGATTLDAWQPSKEGDLLAYQLSAGGTEESVLHVIDVATGELRRGADRPHALLPRRLAARRRGVLLRTPARARAGARRTRSSTTGGSGCTGVGTDPEPTTSRCSAPGWTRPTTTASPCRWTAGGWSIGASAGTAPRNDLWLADLSDGRLEAPDLRVVQEGVDASTSLHVGRDGRVYLFTDRDAPARPAGGDDAGRPRRTTTWTDLVPEDDEAVLEGYAILDGAGADGDRRPRRYAAVRWTRHAMGEVTVHDLLHRRAHRHRPAARARLGDRASPSGPRAATRRGSATPTTSTPSSVYRYDATHRRDHAVGDGARARSRCPRCTPARWSTRPPTAPPCGCSCSRRPRSPTGRGPTVLYGYGGFGMPHDAGLLGRRCWPGSRPAASTRSPTCAAASEEGEQWHRAGMREHKQNVFDDFHAAAERLVADGWTTTGQLAISGGSNGGLLVGAAMTQRPELFAAVVCSAPLLDMVRYEQFGLGATWNDEYGSADDPEELGWLLSATRRTTTCARASTTRRRCSRSSTATPGSTRCTPARCARPCSTRPPGHARSCCAARGTSVTGRAR